MRTTEERMNLIKKRQTEIKTKREKRKMQGREILSIGVCVLFLIFVGNGMPGMIDGMEMVHVSHTSGTASILGSHVALGYILMGILAFLLGMCVTVLLYRIRQKKEREERKENAHEL